MQAERYGGYRFACGALNAHRGGFMQSNDRPSQGIPNLPYEPMPPEPSGYSRMPASYILQRPEKMNGFAIATLVF